jgi:hypothetical protein
MFLYFIHWNTKAKTPKALQNNPDKSALLACVTTRLCLFNLPVSWSSGKQGSASIPDWERNSEVQIQQ